MDGSTKTDQRSARPSWVRGIAAFVATTLIGAVLATVGASPAAAAPVFPDDLRTPAATRTSAGRVDVFTTRSSDWSVLQFYRVPGGSWEGWYSLGSPPSGAATHPTATWKRDGSRIDVFVTGWNRRLYQKYWTSAGWSGWVDLGGELVMAPSASWRGLNRLDVFSVGPDGRMYQRYWTSSGWSAWIGFLAPSAGFAYAPRVQWNEVGNRIDVFATGGNGRLYQRYWTSSGWSGWLDHGGALISGPTATWQGSGYRLDVFGIGTDGRLYQRYCDGTCNTNYWTGWYGFDTLQSGMTAPSAVWDDHGENLQVFASSGAGGLYLKYWDMIDGWYDWRLVALLP